MRLNFTWSDAWVLAAIDRAGGRKGATLREIVAAGELINGAIFMPQELRRGIAKLAQAGYVMTLDECFVIAGRAITAANKFSKRAGPFEIMQFFEDFLDADSFGTEDTKEPDWQYPGLTEDRIMTACASCEEKAA